MRVDTNNLKEGLRLLSLIPSRSGLLSSTNVLLRFAPKNLTLVATAEAHGEVTIPKLEGTYEGTLAVDRSHLDKLVSSLRGKTTLLEPKDNLLWVRSGGRAGKLAILSGASGYLTIPKEVGVRLNEASVAALSASAAFAAQDPVVPEYHRVQMIKAKGVIASDSYCVNYWPDSKAARSVPFPVAICEALKGSKEAKITVGKQGIYIALKSLRLYQPYWHPEASFPNKIMLGLFSVNGAKPLIEVKTASLIQSCKYLSSLSDLGTLSVDDKGKIFLSSSAEKTTFTDRLSGTVLEGLLKKETLHLKKLLDFCTSLPGDASAITVSLTKSCLVFTTSHSSYAQSRIKK